MRKQITISHEATLITVIILSAVLHTVYALIGSDAPGWWVFEISIDRLIVISFLLVISNIIQSKLLTLVARLTAFYYAVMLSFEVLYILSKTINYHYYQLLVSMYLVVMIIIILNNYVRSLR